MFNLYSIISCKRILKIVDFDHTLAQIKGQTSAQLTIGDVAFNIDELHQ